MTDSSPAPADRLSQIEEQLRRLKAENAELANAVFHAVKSLGRDIEYQNQLQATVSSAEYVQRHMRGAKLFRGNRSQARQGVGDLLRHALSLVNGPGFYAEFGVWKGETLTLIANGAEQVVYGFDSFEGLPEDWYPSHAKGMFNLGGALPDLKTERGNVRLIKGWFEDSVPRFAQEVSGPAAFLHIDCDLYSSAKTVLEALGDRIVPGTVIVFDEYLNHPGWQDGEVKAWREFCEARNVLYRYVGFAPVAESVLVVVESVG
jgi:predicted O-methyltransferase YrrM